MLGVGGVAPPSAARVAPKTVAGSSNPIPFSLLVRNQTHKANLLCLLKVPNYTQLLPGRSGFRLLAQKKQKGPIVELEKEEADFVEDEEFEFDGELDDAFDDELNEVDLEEEEEGDDDLMIPFEKMDEWLKKKPRGFGEGKVYDTSIEDKLLEEIEQSRKAQLANLNKLKNESQEANPKTELKKELKASEVVSNVVRVRINNLPKKKNVHRDLKSAFQGVQGIVNISPVVSGTKKTRDPVCKGFGFVDFKSLEEANRFIQMFSGQSVAFGKIQKQIKCEILKSDNGAVKGSVQHGDISTSKPRLAAPEVEVDEDPAGIEDDPQLQFWEDDDFGEFDEDFDDEDIDDFEILTALEEGENDELERDSSSSIHKERAKGVRRKTVTDRKLDKIALPSISGSSMRLKVREKAELSDVFFRPEAKEALTSKQRSMPSVDGGDQDFDTEEYEPPLQLWADDDFDEDDEELDNDDEDDAETIELVRASVQEGDNGLQSDIKPAPASASSIQNKKSKAIAMESEVTKKTPKISIQAVAKMLKIRNTDKLLEFISRSRASYKGRGDQEPNIEEDILRFLEEEGSVEVDNDEEEGIDDFKILSALKQRYETGTKSKTKAAVDSSSSPKPKEKDKAAKKKPAVKGKVNKTPEQKIPRSAKRLKGGDRAKLAGVFTKYGAKKALSSKDM